MDKTARTDLNKASGTGTGTSTGKSLAPSLIAACGMNCGLCSAYHRERNQCPGCNGEDVKKPYHCQKCSIKHCRNIQDSQSKRCYECEVFPCARMKQLDKRYRTKYRMSMVENLLHIKNDGMDHFIVNENIKWRCENCGGIICVHTGACVSCKIERRYGNE